MFRSLKLIAVILLFLASNTQIIAAPTFKDSYSDEAVATIGTVSYSCAGYTVDRRGYTQEQYQLKKNEVFYAYRESQSSVILIGYPHNIRAPVFAIQISPTPKEWDDKININTASHEALRGVSGVRKEVANNIVSKRPYTTWDEIDALPGVGPKLIESLKRIMFIGPKYGPRNLAQDNKTTTP